MKKKYAIALLLLLTSYLYGCSKTQNSESVHTDPKNDTEVSADEQPQESKEEKSIVTEKPPEIVDIDVTSESLTKEGKWLSSINQATSNLSPQLSWSEVEGATFYTIYMIDNSAGNWLHWKARKVQGTSLEMGAELEGSDYIGPYPPSGTHEYEIIVYALKEAPDKYAGSFNFNNPDYQAIEKKLDTANGQPGNIIGKGSIVGTVTVGEIVE